MKKYMSIFIIFITLSCNAFGWDADSFDNNTRYCNSGDAIGCANLGIMYLEGHYVQQSYFNAKEFFLKACNLGDSQGCYNIGVSYEKGLGVRQDYSKAKEFYGKACDMNDDLGCKGYANLNKR